MSVVRHFLRQLRSKLPSITVAVSVCFLVYLVSNEKEEQSYTGRLLRSPYERALQNVNEDLNTPNGFMQDAVVAKPLGAPPKDMENVRAKVNDGMLSNVLKNNPAGKPVVKEKPPPEGNSGLMSAREAGRNPDDPLANRPDLTMTTKTKIYPYILNFPEVCERSPELIVIVCSVPTNFEKRKAVRETWGSEVNNPDFKINMVFLLGGNKTSDEQVRLQEESKKFKDIIQKDFFDSYMNLTLKSLVMLEWVTDFCSNSKYLLKADDDMYFNLPNLVTALRQHKDEKFIMGHLHDKGIPVRDKRSKWYIPREMYPKDNYPPFTVGVGYSMTTTAGMTLYKTAQNMSFFPMEDVYMTGIVGSKAGISRYNNDGFYDKWRAPSCNFTKTIAEHKHTPEEMYIIHKIVKGGKC